MVEYTRKLPEGWVYRRELAMSYFPDTKDRVAVARLTRWIMTDPQFHEELVRKGYRPGIRTFSPRIMRVFRKYMG